MKEGLSGHQHTLNPIPVMLRRRCTAGYISYTCKTAAALDSFYSTANKDRASRDAKVVVVVGLVTFGEQEDKFVSLAAVFPGFPGPRISPTYSCSWFPLATKGAMDLSEGNARFFTYSHGNLKMYGRRSHQRILFSLFFTCQECKRLFQASMV